MNPGRVSTRMKILLWFQMMIFIVIFPTRFLYSQYSLSFGGTNAYVAFGNDTILGLPEFTLECWFKKSGAGVSTTTGTYGVVAVPLIAKGRAEADGSTVDMNYFLGINTTTATLVADFEEGTGQSSPGLNHPVSGITPVLNDIWYHACVTYDSVSWKLYLNGMLEAQTSPSVLPQQWSVQHSSLASALNSTGGTFRLLQRNNG